MNTLSETSVRSSTSTQEPCNVQPQKVISVSSIPFNHLIFSPSKTVQQVLEHCRKVYDAVQFSKGLTPKVLGLLEEKVNSGTILLKGLNNKNKFKKTLLLDLDETLIHCRSQNAENFSYSILIGSTEVKFNVRPYAFQFLANMSKIYELVLFTAAEQEYAQAFFHFFNQHTNQSISDLLCRNHCIRIYKNIYFKDLRIISNRNLKDMILLDNSPHCFGLQLDNGIPILNFTEDNSDMQLMHMEEFLSRISQSADVRKQIREELRLTNILGVKKL